MKLDYTFHSHTYRCNHASGDIPDYLEYAIKNEFKIYGVSDHVFLPGVIEPHTRGNYELLDGYIDAFKSAKAKYGSDIKMYLGFECEYSDLFLDYYKYLLKDRGIDYLICGQHNAFNSDKSVYNYFNNGKEGLVKLKDDIISAMKSGLFLYIAHPDIVFQFCDKVDEFFASLGDEIIEAAIKYDAVLEINRHGLIRNRYPKHSKYVSYPCDYFWNKVSKTNIRVVVGGDYHSPIEIEDQQASIDLEALIKRNNIRLSNIEDIYQEYQNRLKTLGIR